MKKVVYANVGGRCFAFDEDAFSRLNSYLSHYEDCLGANKAEAMLDLEGRLAEMFLQGTGGQDSLVVTLNSVEKAAETIGMPEPSQENQGQDGDAGQESFSQFQSEKRTSSAGANFAYSGIIGTEPRNLFRDPDRKAFGGVCSGLALFLNIDITIVRICLLLSLLLWGSGLIVYIVLWIVIPLAKTPEDKCAMHGLAPTRENLDKFRIPTSSKDYRKSRSNYSK